MQIPKSTQFKALQLEKMPPGEHWTIEPKWVVIWGEMWIRRNASGVNHKYNIYLQCHKNKDGSLTVWHNPERKLQNKSAAFDKLLWLRKQLEEYRRRKADDSHPNAYIEELLAIQDQINSALEELQHSDGEPLKNRGNAIHQPLPVILEFYGINEKVWNLLPKRVQGRNKIQAEVAIKNKRRAEEGQI